MKAGNTNLDVGTKVKIINIKGEDSDLNGLTGVITHPFAFGCTRKGWIGIWLDAGEISNRRGGSCNVRVIECEIIKNYSDGQPV